MESSTCCSLFDLLDHLMYSKIATDVCLESSHLTVFSRSSHLTVFTKSVQNTFNGIDCNILLSNSQLHFLKVDVSIVIWSFITYWEYLERCVLKQSFIKTEFDKYATSRERGCSITSIYLIHFIMDQNCHDSC